MTRPQRYGIPTSVIMLLVLAGCGSDASIEQTNAQQTEQLNAIAANTSETAGNTQAGGSGNTAADLAVRARTPTRPRKY